MVIKDALNFGQKTLEDLEYIDPFFESVYILSFLLNKDRSYILTNLDENLNPKIIDTYKDTLDKRQEGIPLAYIIRKKYFYDKYFNVNENVLIPRADTEILIEVLLERYKNKKALKILDIGTGSGIIAITLARHLDGQVLGVDISEKALDAARSNVDRNLNNINFVNSDLFENVTGLYDIIVSNPPYINDYDMENLQKEVKSEPELALRGGVDGLRYYREIIKNSREHLKTNGTVALEIGWDQKNQVVEIFEQNGFKNIECYKDLSKNDRVVLGELG